MVMFRSAAILRTCYSNEEIDNMIEETTLQLVQSELDNIMGKGLFFNLVGCEFISFLDDSSDFPEVPRQSQALNDYSYEHTINGTDAPTTVYERSEVPVRDTSDTSSQRLDPNESIPIGQNLFRTNLPQSPVHEQQSVTSYEAVTSRMVCWATTPLSVSTRPLRSDHDDPCRRSQRQDSEEDAQVAGEEAEVACGASSPSQRPSAEEPSEEDCGRQPVGRLFVGIRGELLLLLGFNFDCLGPASSAPQDRHQAQAVEQSVDSARGIEGHGQEASCCSVISTWY